MRLSTYHVLAIVGATTLLAVGGATTLIPYASLRAASSTASAHIPSGKLALISKALARLQKARQDPTPKIPNPSAFIPPPLPGPAPVTLPAGIQSVTQGDFSSLVFLAQNFWSGPVTGTTRALVWAGQEQQPVVQGAVRVELDTPTGGGNFDYQYVGTFPAPTGTSPVHVIAWRGTVLTLATASGQAATFNVTTDTYSP